jgi:hypothetical protein
MFAAGSGIRIRFKQTILGGEDDGGYVIHLTDPEYTPESAAGFVDVIVVFSVL